MRVDLDAELARISGLLDEAQKKAAYWADDVKRLTGAKDFCEHLLHLADQPEPNAPSSGGPLSFDDEPINPALVGANGSHG